jgi:hypothetical protein
VPKRRKTRPSSAPKRRRPQRRRPEAREPDILDTVRIALDSGLAWPLLDYASYLLDLVDERNVPLDQPPEEEGPTLEDLASTFLAVPRYESSALLAALAGLADDEFLRLRVRGEIAERGHELPEWLVALDAATAVDRAVLITEPLDDGYQVLIGATLRGGHDLTAVVFIDNNRNSAVTSAFVVPRPLADTAAEMQELAEDPDLTFGDLSPADARVHITEAIDEGDQFHPPLTSDTWPATRPLLEWMTSLLPSGGSGRPVAEWSDAKLDELADRFLTSSFGEAWRGRDMRSLVDEIFGIASTLASGDPARISPTGAEIVLLDVARIVAAGHAEIDDAPAVLRDVIRFGHAERGLPADVTDEAVGVVDEFEAAYRERVDEWRRRLGGGGGAPVG